MEINLQITQNIHVQNNLKTIYDIFIEQSTGNYDHILSSYKSINNLQENLTGPTLKQISSIQKYFEKQTLDKNIDDPDLIFYYKKLNKISKIIYDVFLDYINTLFKYIPIITSFYYNYNETNIILNLFKSAYLKPGFMILLLNIDIHNNNTVSKYGIINTPIKNIEYCSQEWYNSQIYPLLNNLFNFIVSPIQWYIFTKDNDLRNYVDYMYKSFDVSSDIPIEILIAKIKFVIFNDIFKILPLLLSSYNNIMNYESHFFPEILPSELLDFYKIYKQKNKETSLIKTKTMIKYVISQNNITIYLLDGNILTFSYK